MSLYITWLSIRNIIKITDKFILLSRWRMLQERIKNYQKELDDLGIRDYQVQALLSETEDTDGDVVLREMRLPLRIAELILLFLVSLIPALFLNLPVGLIARLHAHRKRKKALAASSVKVKGMDVLLSEKVRNINNYRHLPLHGQSPMNHFITTFFFNSLLGFTLYCAGSFFMDDLRASADNFHKS